MIEESILSMETPSTNEVNESELESQRSSIQHQVTNDISNTYHNDCILVSYHIRKIE